MICFTCCRIMHIEAAYMEACDPVDRGFNFHCWSCVEVSGTLLIPESLCLPSRDGFVCLCILHQLCLTITARTANCPILGGLDSSLHLLWRELGSLSCLKVTLPRTRSLHLEHDLNCLSARPDRQLLSCLTSQVVNSNDG